MEHDGLQTLCCQNNKILYYAVIIHIQLYSGYGCYGLIYLLIKESTKFIRKYHRQVQTKITTGAGQNGQNFSGNVQDCLESVLSLKAYTKQK